MPRYKSSVPTPQPSTSLHSRGEEIKCPNDYCEFSTRSSEAYNTHKLSCPYEPFRAPTSKCSNSAPTIPDDDEEDLIVRPASEKNGQSINGNARVPNERDGSPFDGDDGASSSTLSDPPPSNISDIDFEVPGMSRAARKLLYNTVRPYADGKSVYYESVREGQFKSSPALQNLEETEASANESSTPADEAQDSDSPLMPPTPKRMKHSDEFNSGKYPFLEFTEIKNFEEFLTGAPEMDFNDLYHRTSAITRSLMAYQSEWSRIDKEVRNHEESLRLKSLTAAERAKLASDERQAEEDIFLAALEQKYKLEILLPRKLWVEEFSAQFIAENPDRQNTLDLLNKLRDQVFRKGFQKRRRLLNDNPIEDLVEKPLPDTKQTKEERDLESRKRRFLTDAITFDDMNQADAYGFPYVASDLARGNQIPVPRLRVTAVPRGMGGAASRPNRNASKGFVPESEENSEAPSPAEEELPTKRSRAKPKKLEDDANEASSAADTSRASSAKTYLGTDGVRRYIGSNKPSGRPAAGNKPTASKANTKSKLDQMSLAGQIDPNGLGDEPCDEPEGELSNGQVLPADQADELQQAAESLFNQTSPVERRRGPGRPKKEARPAKRIKTEETADSAPKLKGKGGRKKKVQPAQTDTAAEPGEVEGDEEVEGEGDGVVMPKARGKPGRKKRTRDDDAENETGTIAKRARSEETPTTSAKGYKKQDSNGTAQAGRDQGDHEEPAGSFESFIPTGGSSRPATSSSKEAGSRASSPPVSKPATKTLKLKLNGKHGRVDGEEDDEEDEGGSTADSSEYRSEADDGPPPPKKARTATAAVKRKINGRSTMSKASGDTQTKTDKASGTPKKKKPSAKRKHGALEGGINGGGNGGEATGDNSDADDGNQTGKKSKKSREKTAQEKASQAAAMRGKWADENGKMRQGIERRKRRVARKQFEKSRNGDPDRPGFLYKSDQEGFDYAYFNEVAPTGAPEPVQASAAVLNPTSTPQDEHVSIGDEEDEELEDEEEEEDQEEDDEGEAKEADLVVEAPKKAETGRSTALGLTTTRSGRQSKPSRKVNPFAMDGAADDSDDSYERPAGNTQKSESTYDEFQKLTSPGHHLGKRVSKQLYQVNYGTTSEEEEFS